MKSQGTQVKSLHPFKLALSLCLISRHLALLPWGRYSLWTCPSQMWQQSHMTSIWVFFVVVVGRMWSTSRAQPVASTRVSTAEKKETYNLHWNVKCKLLCVCAGLCCATACCLSCHPPRKLDRNRLTLRVLLCVYCKPSKGSDGSSVGVCQGVSDLI